MFTFIDALLDTVPAEAVAALWIDICISASHEANWTLKFISKESVEKLKRRGCHVCNVCVRSEVCGQCQWQWSVCGLLIFLVSVFCGR